MAPASSAWMAVGPALKEQLYKKTPTVILTSATLSAGGNDGFTQSNTYALERRHGWRGILVEPVPELARACALERPGARVVRAALVADDNTGAEVTLRFGGLMTLIADWRWRLSSQSRYARC